MSAWKTTLLLSCLATQTTYAQPALDPAFIHYLIAFGDDPELFDAVSEEVEQQQTKPNTQNISKTKQKISPNITEIKQ